MQTIISSLLHFAESRPEAPALVDRSGEITYSQVAQRTKAAAAWLYQSGVRKGDTVALSVGVLPESVLGSLQFFYGLAYLGAVVLPLHPRTPSARAIELVEDLGARYWIDSHVPPPARSATLLDPRGFAGSGNASLNSIPPRGDDPDSPFQYQYTSGTTGGAKLILRSAGQVARLYLSLSDPFGATAADRQVSSQPWPEKTGLRDLMQIHLVGGTFVNSAFPETRQSLANLIHNFGVTQLSASPWQLRCLLNSEAPPGLRLPPLRVLSVIGALVFPQDVLACRETMTPNIFVTYGSTEVGVVSCLRPEESAAISGRVGKPIPFVEAQAVDDEHRPVPAGTVGNLRFRAPWMSQSYVNNEAATARSFHDGWFYPGDLGSLDADGYLVLHGRSDDIINYGGVKIAPGYVEQVLRQYPDVLDAAVIGVPDAMAGQLPIGFLVLRRPISKTDFRDYCAQQLEGNQIPTRFFTIAEIPRNPEGKILRDRLSSMQSAF